ncbi:MAG: hypothetical protein EOO54_10980 [Haliea sp.]|nr:MAG: hypothetical protein EOO54_10980 [Haliea sp.]
MTDRVHARRGDELVDREFKSAAAHRDVHLMALADGAAVLGLHLAVDHEGAEFAVEIGAAHLQQC